MPIDLFKQINQRCLPESGNLELDMLDEVKRIDTFLPNIQVKNAVYHGNCKIHGDYEAPSFIVNFGHKTEDEEKVRFVPCPQCEEEKVENNIIQKPCPFYGTKVAPRFKEATISGLNVKTTNEKTRQVTACEYIKQISEGKHTGDLILFGNTGTGKTYFASAVINDYANLGKRSRYITLFELLCLFHKTEKSYSYSIDDLTDEFLSYDILTLDEIGLQTLTDKETAFLTYFIDSRMNNYKSTVYVSNLKEDALYSYLGDRIKSRILPNAKSLNFGVVDKRSLTCSKAV